MPMRALGAEAPYHRFWGQIIRWLAHVETRQRTAGASVVLRVDREHVRTGQQIRLTARVDDPKGRPATTATVTCSIVDAKDRILQILSLTGGQTEGLFEGRFKPTEPGEFRLKVSAADLDGQKLGSDELPLTVAAYSAEMDRLARNDELLRQVAAKSGGISEDIGRLPELIDKMVQSRQALVVPPKVRVTSLYDFTALFILFVVLLTAEWLLRRNWQLH